MQSSSNNFNDLQFLCGTGENLDKMPLLRPLEPFSEQICCFFGALSSEIMKRTEAKQYPDVITFGFFCRKGNIEKLRKPYEGRLSDRLGRGVSFHIAPSNVPINFAYSMAAALLAGNSCIVRVSAKPFPQIDLVCDCINKTLNSEEYGSLSEHIKIVRYPRDKQINDLFSSLADIRVIWGGDNTIAELRTSPLPPRAVEIAFADRYSIAVINAAGYIETEDKQRVAQSFYNDTYLYDQNACSSPRLIYWLGGNVTARDAKALFWEELHRLLSERYTVEPIVAVNKYTADCRLAIDKKAKITPVKDNLINRIEVKELFADIYDYRCAGGSFIEYTDTDLDALSKIVTRKYQTLSYLGIDAGELAAFIREKGVCGIDRIVPIGQTSDFALVWDGYDLIMQMTRVVSAI